MAATARPRQPAERHVPERRGRRGDPFRSLLEAAQELPALS